MDFKGILRKTHIYIYIYIYIYIFMLKLTSRDFGQNVYIMGAKIQVLNQFVLSKGF